MDRQEIINELAKRKILLNEDDPIFALVDIQEIMIKGYSDAMASLFKGNTALIKNEMDNISARVEIQLSDIATESIKNHVKNIDGQLDKHNESVKKLYAALVSNIQRQFNESSDKLQSNLDDARRYNLSITRVNIFITIANLSLTAALIAIFYMK